MGEREDKYEQISRAIGCRWKERKTAVIIPVEEYEELLRYP